MLTQQAAVQVDTEVKKIVESVLHEATQRTGVTLADYVKGMNHAQPPRTDPPSSRPAADPDASGAR